MIYARLDDLLAGLVAVHATYRNRIATARRHFRRASGPNSSAVLADL